MKRIRVTERSLKWFKFAVFCPCMILFLVQISDINRERLEELTSTSVSYLPFTEMELPHITVCPKIPFKEGYSDLNIDAFLNGTFQPHEIFMETTLNNEFFPWNRTEIWTFLFGRCFTFGVEGTYHPVTLVPIHIKPNVSVRIFIHGKGEEIFLPVFITPLPIAIVDFDAEWGKISAADIRIWKKVNSLLPKSRKQVTCATYTEAEESFTECARDFIRKSLYQRMDCISPYVMQFVDDDFQQSLPECTDPLVITRQQQIFYNIYWHLALNNASNSCRLPCNTTFYQSDIMTFHPSSMKINNGYERSVLYFYYKYSFTTITEERLVYDFPTLVSTVGGSLGFYLGWSIYSVMNKVIDIMYAKWMRHKPDQVQ